MSESKKNVRANFRNDCWIRDKYKCVCCSLKFLEEEASAKLDVHHISPRTEMPAGGYVRENGISLCSACHVKAEMFYSTGVAEPGYSPFDLYCKIGSTYEKAVAASKKLAEK